MIKFFGFDGDGCLYDTRSLACEATLLAAQHLGGEASHSTISSAFSSGLSLGEIFSIAAPEADPAEMVRQFYRFDEILGYDRVKLYPFARKTLHEIGKLGIARALITNRNRISTENLLGHLKIATEIDYIVTSDDVEQHKPDPEGINSILKLISVNPLQSSYIGDTAGDMLTGIRAQLGLVLGFTQGFSSSNDLLHAGAHKTVDSWEDILSYIQ